MELENGEGEKKKKEDRLNVPTGWDGGSFHEGRIMLNIQGEL
jgi:hypothetical protein